MSLPVYAKVWDTSTLNQRISYVSLNDTMSRYLFGIKNYLVSTMGASVVYSCDGTTGPSSSSDHTDRWTTFSNCTTRGASSAAAQSFCVLSWAGVEVMLTYQGATDDVARVSISQGSLFTPAGTATNQPTATDENIMMATASLINAGTSLDRVWSIIATTDRTVFKVCLFRNATLIGAWGVELILEAPGVTAGCVVGWSTALTYNQSFQTGGCSGGSATANAIGSTVCRVNGANIQPCGGTVTFEGASVTTSLFATNPELNAGAPLFPLIWGSLTAGNTGWLGTRYDTYFPYTNGALTGDTYDDISQGTRMVIIGAAGLWAWSPSAGVTTS